MCLTAEGRHAAHGKSGHDQRHLCQSHERRFRNHGGGPQQRLRRQNHWPACSPPSSRRKSPRWKRTASTPSTSPSRACPARPGVATQGDVFMVISLAGNHKEALDFIKKNVKAPTSQTASAIGEAAAVVKAPARALFYALSYRPTPEKKPEAGRVSARTGSQRKKG